MYTVQSKSLRSTPLEEVTPGLEKALNASGLKGASTAEQLDVGTDSKVYLLEIGDRKEVLKVYDTSIRPPEERTKLDRYQAATNLLASKLEKEGFSREISVQGEIWNVDLKVTPIEATLTTENGVSFAIVPYVDGTHMEDMYATVNIELRTSLSGNLGELEILQIDSEQVSRIPMELYYEIFGELFWLSNPDRLEGALNQFINEAIGGTEFRLDPKNVKMRIDCESRKVQLIVTDLTGVLYDMVIPEIEEGV